MAGGDVEKAQFVGTRVVIGARLLDRIAGVAQIDEVDALHDPAVVDVETGDDAMAADGHARRDDSRAQIEPAVVERPPGDRRRQRRPRRNRQRRDVVDDATPPEAITGSRLRARDPRSPRRRTRSAPSRPMSVNSSAATPASSKRRARSTAATSLVSAQPSTATIPSRASIRPRPAREIPAAGAPNRGRAKRRCRSRRGRRRERTRRRPPRGADAAAELDGAERPPRGSPRPRRH